MQGPNDSEKNGGPRDSKEIRIGALGIPKKGTIGGESKKEGREEALGIPRES